MSIFDPATNPDEVTAETLVGDGKKYRDVNELAKGKVHADLFIAQLQEENAGLRKELETGLTVQEILDQRLGALTANTAPKGNESQSPPTPAAPTPEPAIKREDLAALVREVTSAEQKAQIEASNAQLVEQKLLETYGTEERANQAIKARAADLGVSLEFLQSVAIQSPKAFFAQIGLDSTQAPPAQATRSDVNTAQFSSAPNQIKPGTYAYYEQIRKASPSEYFSPKVQNQLFKDRLEKGDRFYNP